MSEPLEERIAALLARTPLQNERYASAHYRGPTQWGETGLGNRLEALEHALMILAREIDAMRVTSTEEHQPDKHAP
jgi:hypothetical protein